MTSRTGILDGAVADYIVANTTPPDALARRLIDQTREMSAGGMQISHPQAQFMAMLTNLLRPKLAIEIGTFTGYSALVVARALADDAKLIACDISEEWTSIGRAYWEEAGVADRIDLRIGPAAETLAALDPATRVDLVFIDADKTGYLGYFEQLVPLLSPQGVILVDNVLWNGKVADPDDQRPDTIALREFSAHVVADPRVRVALLPIGDGLSMITRA